MMGDAVEDKLGRYAAQAVIVATETGLVAEHRAGAAGHGELHDVGFGLSPPLEAAIGVRGAPDAHHRGGHERRQVHIG